MKASSFIKCGTVTIERGTLNNYVRGILVALLLLACGALYAVNSRITRVEAQGTTAIPSMPGRILNNFGNTEGFAIGEYNTDGTNPINLTALQYGSDFLHPSQSKQTGMIAFAGCLSTADRKCGFYSNNAPTRIYVMNGDGTNIRQITFDDGSANNDPGSADSVPVISPDGTKVAFISGRSNYPLAANGQKLGEEAYVVNVDGTNLHQVSTKQVFQVDSSGTVARSKAYSVAWSPDSASVAVRCDRKYRLAGSDMNNKEFFANYESLNSMIRIFSVDAANDGTLVAISLLPYQDTDPYHGANFSQKADRDKAISNYTTDGYPRIGGLYGEMLDWSPTGDTIIASIVTVNRFGGGFLNQGRVYYGVFNPSGGLRTTLTSQALEGGATTGDLNGDTTRELCATPGCARISPDGQQLVYGGYNANPETRIANIDGSNEHIIGTSSMLGGYRDAKWWSAGAPIPTPVQLVLKPNPVVVNENQSVQLLPMLLDAQGNVIARAASYNRFFDSYLSTGVVCDGAHPCSGNYFTPTVNANGVLTAPPTNSGGSVTFCAENAGLIGCTVVQYRLFSVTATTPTTFKSGTGGPGVFTITRIGKADTSALVTFVLGGSAKRDVDYTLDFSGNTIGIPAGQTSVNINVRPLSNSPNTGDKTVTLAIQSADATNTASLAIKDDAASFDLSLASVTPNKGGNQGVVSVTVSGQNIKQGATIKLTRAGQSDITGQAVTALANGSSLSATFNLTGKTQGVWDVVVTNPNGKSVTLPGAFTIEETRAANGWVDVLGRSVIAPHRSSTFGIQYGNTGNVNVYDVLLLVHLPKGVAVTGLDGAVVPPYVQPAPGLDGVSVQTDTETLVPIWFYVLPAGVSRTISFAVNLQDKVQSGSFEIKAELLLPPPFEAEFSRTGDFATLPAYYGPSSKKNPFFIALLYLELAKAIETRQRVSQLIQGVLDGGLVGSKAARLAELSQSDPTFKSGSALANFATPEQGGITHPLDKSDDYLNTFNPNQPGFNTAVNFNNAKSSGDIQSAFDTGPLPAPYAIALGGFLSVLGGAALVAGSPLAIPAVLIGGAYDLYSIFSAGNTAQALVAKYQVRVAGSLDPNELVGSLGAGTQRYISGQEPLRYAIYFENKPEASAPAQMVVVTDQLDISKMDLSTFSLGVIRLGGTNTVTPPFGQKTFSTDVDLRPAKNIIVRINAGLNSSTGLVTWTFNSIDPTTGRPPEDVLAGFLPPNINGTDGEGSVVFTVQPKDLPTGAEARNKARIVFDQNAPIDTNEWLNTIDNSKPVSRVAALDASQPSIVFNVKWAGTDTGSGINTYTVYVSENGGAFTIWQNATTDTSGLFAGQPGKTYSFYSVARDKANNAEAAKTVAEATTTIVSSSLQNSIDDMRFFVRQQYLDFLNREPDTGGFDYWTSLITSCPNSDAQCINSRRVTVSAAFFIEQEFQDTGSFVYRFYKGSLGRPPAYDEFVSDRSRVIGGTNLEASKAAFAETWTQRPEFLDKYPATLSPEQFVDALLQTVKQTSNVDLTGSRQNFINQLQAGGTRGQVIRAVVDAQAFQKAEYNRAFVLMQYFGYLRRDPDTAGYNFWLDILNNRVANNYRSMVCAFITSAEYQLRFGSTVTRTDAVCGSIGQ